MAALVIIAVATAACFVIEVAIRKSTMEISDQLAKFCAALCNAYASGAPEQAPATRGHNRLCSNDLRQRLGTRIAGLAHRI
ncbi:hypothetical protein [Bradyrhizobium sp. SRS-191]|uniref:hypothetical protein n=1 Tax=Bradyrhizobium sp. SRS-191 TaxID=2962606 RepID=UPI00211EF196|nr:hypothetical protein [Bradyrhizobium sp. SRS-191]